MHHLVQKIRTSRGNTFWNTLMTRRFSLPTYRYTFTVVSSRVPRGRQLFV